MTCAVDAPPLRASAAASARLAPAICRSTTSAYPEATAFQLFPVARPT